MSEELYLRAKSFIKQVAWETETLMHMGLMFILQFIKAM